MIKLALSRLRYIDYVIFQFQFLIKTKNNFIAYFNLINKFTKQNLQNFISYFNQNIDRILFSLWERTSLSRKWSQFNIFSTYNITLQNNRKAFIKKNNCRVIEEQDIFSKRKSNIIVVKVMFVLCMCILYIYMCNLLCLTLKIFSSFSWKHNKLNVDCESTLPVRLD